MQEKNYFIKISFEKTKYFFNFITNIPHWKIKAIWFHTNLIKKTAFISLLSAIFKAIYIHIIKLFFWFVLNQLIYFTF